jgi:O-antigen/teichoic acid export membrane protein
MNNESGLATIGLRMRLAYLRARLVQPYRHSIVRRTGILLAFVLPAFAANFVVQYGAARLLSVDQFGVFYVANNIGNVLFSGSVVLNTFFTRYLVSLELSSGTGTAYLALLRIERVVVLYGAGCAAAIFVFLLLVASQIGVQSRIIVLLIVLDAYTAYVADLGRILLQSVRRTVQLGLYTLVWMLLRLVFCMAAIYAFGTVPAALGGLIASAVVMLAGLHVWTVMHRRSDSAALPPLPSARTLVPVFVSFGLLIAVSNLDVLLGYFLLSESDLGAYSASSILPKAIVVLTMPLLQMLFPMLARHDPAVQRLRVVLGKSGLLILALTSGAVGFIWAASGWLCGGPWSIRYCEVSTMNILLLSAVPLVILRGLALFQFARGRDWLATSLVVPTIGYLHGAWHFSADPVALAKGFVLFALASLLFLSTVHVCAGVLGSRRMAG